MQTISRIKNLNAIIKTWKQAGLTIAFIPTMGNLHAGHLALIKAAKYKADKIVVSIFVNPTQFGANEDFDSYPRTEQQDAQQLACIGVNMLFLPAISEIYSQEAKTMVSVNELAAMHCGVFRRGHFEGVATIVCKLFNLIQPDIAVFGEKDFQQLTLIRILVRDLNFPIDIDSMETIRESDGLAMSSRNRFLTTEERLLAPKLYTTLCATKEIILAKRPNYAQIQTIQQQFLRDLGFQVEYFSICRRKDLQLADKNDAELVILLAVRLGKVRLIDNIMLDFA